MNRPCANISELARHAGLSRSATAYALRNHPNSSRATRERIQKLARELGYRPDPILGKLMSRLRQKRERRYAGQLAFINPDKDRSYPDTTPAVRDFLHHAKMRAEEIGYRVEEFWLHEPGRSPQRLAHMLQSRGIEGIILGPQKQYGSVSRFPWSDFAAVTIGYSVSEPTLMRVVSHHYRNTLLAMEKVLATGYQRPGLLTLRSQEDAMVKLHVAAFLAHQQEMSPKNRVALMNSDAMNPKVIRTWFDEQKPDVILTTNYPARLHFAERGIRIPDDVALVSVLRWDDEKGIAGVRPGMERLGTTAVNLLASQLQHDERGIPESCTTVELEGRWVDDASMPAPAKIMGARAPASRKTKIGMGPNG
ncbi:MAG: LacI family transcriptional regulator [Opitutaceae bacterium]|jgi:LacI family transcriptional regulator|nr:LacI family transcriptional regulator [Opitutaceae bacterium]